MKRFTYKHLKAIGIAGVLTLGMTLLLINEIPLFISHPEYVPQPIYWIIFLWLVLSFLVYKFPLYQVLIVQGLLLFSILAEHQINVRDNAITMPLLILFWLGITYFILPQFFSKYRIAILSVYGLVILYYFIFREATSYAVDHRQGFAKFIVLPIPFFMALWVYEQWRWLQTLKAEKAKSELALLKNQINPHFFFNTLNNLYGLAVEKSDQTPAMILKLSDIMRYTIYDGKSDYVALKDEVNYLEDYINLHLIRYQKGVDISFQTELQHPHKIAPLMLIVPLENAFKHGVESLEENAFIDLSIKTSETSIFFEVKNNYEPKLKNGEGIGLSNLMKRLTLIYPDRHHLTMDKTENHYTFSLEIKP